MIDKSIVSGAMEDSIIQGIHIFEDLDSSERAIVGAVLTCKECAPNDVIYTEGDKGNSLNIILKGKVRINRATVEGDQFCIATLKKGDIFGTMSFLDGSPHDATIVSDQLTELTVLEKSDFDRLILSKPLTAAKILRRLSMHLAALVRNMNSQYMDVMNLMFRKGK